VQVPFVTVKINTYKQMKKRKLIIKSALALITGASIFISCLDDPEPAALDAMPDVFAQKMVKEGEEKISLNFWVQGNKELASVTVEGPEDGTWTLEKDENSNSVFKLLPESEDYTASFPETGTYTFTVTSTQANEDPLTVTDELGEEELEIPVINFIEYENDKLKTNWEPVTNADRYLIRLYDHTDNLIYVGPQLGSSETEYSFGLSEQGWLDPDNKPEEGETYPLELIAIRYESDVDFNKEYNIQFLSITSTEVVWGE
jgi:hypothetical protein